MATFRQISNNQFKGMWMMEKGWKDKDKGKDEDNDKDKDVDDDG